MVPLWNLNFRDYGAKHKTKKWWILPACQDLCSDWAYNTIQSHGWCESEEEHSVYGVVNKMQETERDLKYIFYFGGTTP